MKKSFPYISLVVAVALFNGCGGSTSSDTQAPSLTSTKYLYENVLEDASVEVTLASDDAKAKFLETSTETTISGNMLTFTAPPFVSGSTNQYVVAVTAKDEAGNESAPKEFTFNVIEVNTKTYASDSSIVVPDTGASFTADGSFLVGPTGLLWIDEVSPLMNYANASTYCTNKGTDFRIASRTELLNTMDYGLDGSSDVSLLNTNFSTSRAGTGDNKVETSWAAIEGSVYFQVNNFSGLDVRANATDEHRVRCVKGTAAGAHTFSGSTDTTTGLEWTVITAQAEYDDVMCPADSSLPTINQLRSIFDYNTNKLNIAIAPATVNTVWSRTGYTNHPTATPTYYIILNEQDTSIRSDEHNQTAYVTCVK